MFQNKNDPLEVSATTRIVAVLIIHRQRVLVGRRATNAWSAKGLHEFPGGKVEQGESATQAATRECLEETGLAVYIERPLASTLTDEEGFEIAFFVGRLRSSKDPKPLEPFRWQSLAELELCTFPKANLPVVNWLRQSSVII
ncbi:NUDIX domain-containing protein [Pirellulales bacterium]|nr:NUDIX domain-containing protein [Pirellulales bacterium]